MSYNYSESSVVIEIFLDTQCNLFFTDLLSQMVKYIG